MGEVREQVEEMVEDTNDTARQIANEATRMVEELPDVEDLIEE